MRDIEPNVTRIGAQIMPMMHKDARFLGVACMVLGLLTVAGCASVVSYSAGKVEEPETPAAAKAEAPVRDGIIYYMPKRPIKVSITFPPADKPQTGVPTVDTISAVADRSARFFLEFENNLIGKNHASIGVNAQGLLTTANADTTSGIPTIVKNIATALGDATALAAAAAVPTEAQGPCDPGRTYTKLFYPESLPKDAKICEFSVEIKNADGSPIIPKQRPPHTERIAKIDSKHYGVFYKQELPYLVVITDPKTNRESQFIATSPDLGPIAFAPVTRGFFANNETKITLVEGVVTATESTTTGELVALSELPADFIAAYTAAIGQLFSTLGANTQSQTTLLNNQNALAVAKIKQTACTAAIEANKSALDPSKLAGLTGAALTTAMTNINTALANIGAVCR